MSSVTEALDLTELEQTPDVQIRSENRRGSLHGVLLLHIP